GGRRTAVAVEERGERNPAWACGVAADGLAVLVAFARVFAAGLALALTAGLALAVAADAALAAFAFA
ncbi:MAG: hypothetical protein KGZ67_04110, partial [Hydrogenophaga sp.]|nr:hypothetical protein [Hydrogenophaga sp.]